MIAAVASEYDRLVAIKETYLIWGDLDKPFHGPECECERCEEWRRGMGRPTHKDLRDLIKEERRLNPARPPA